MNMDFDRHAAGLGWFVGFLLGRREAKIKQLDHGRGLCT